MDVLIFPEVRPVKLLAPEVVRLPVQTFLYQQAMAENGQGDRPKPLGVGLPWGHVFHQQ
jgi:hypothetical protein